MYNHSVYIPGMATSPGDAKHGGVWGSASCVGVINLELQRHLYHIRIPINIAIPIGPNVNNYQGFQFFGVFNHAGILIIIGVPKNKLTIYRE